MEGIGANGKHSYRNFGAEIAERYVGVPKRREVKEKVPYMHGAYDFGMLAGEPIYEENELRYTFDIAEFDTETMETKKDELTDWLNNIVDTDIEDDFIKNYYFHGGIKQIDWEEDFGEGHLTATFEVYPFKIAKNETKKEITGSATIINDSSHSVFPTITAKERTHIKWNGVEWGIPAGTNRIEEFALKKGENKIEVTSGTITVAWRKERF